MSHQVGLDRALPMWGGVAAGGFGAVAFHQTKKMNSEEWLGYLKQGKLRSALAAINPDKPDGPWTVVCDGERFLHTKDAQQIYRQQKITLLTIPPRSPDLNPVEKFWAWLRKQLHAKDLKDLNEGRQIPGKAAYKARIRSILGTARAKQVAGNIANGWRKTCAAVVAAKGAAVKG